jgi:hypothetical protein
LELVLKAHFLPWLQPAALLSRPIGAIRRPGGHTFMMWPTSDCLGTPGPLDLDCVLFLLLNGGGGAGGQGDWGTGG